MTFSKLMLSSVAALALVACGKKEDGGEAPKTEISASAAKTNSASPLDSQFRLKDAELVDVEGLLALIPADERPTYDSVTFEKEIGATVISNLRLGEGSDGQSILIERAELYGLNEGAIDAVRNAEDVSATSPFETVFQKVRLLNVSAEGLDEEEGEFTIGGVEFDQLQIRRGGVEGDGMGDEGARFFNAINLGGLYFKDAKFSASEENTADVIFSAPDLRFVGLGGGKLGAVIAKDLNYEMKQSAQTIAALNEAMGPAGAMLSGPLKNLVAPESQKGSIATFEWRGIDFSGLMGWGLKGEEPPVSERNLINLGELKFGKVDTYVGEKLAATAEEATISIGKFAWFLPESFRAETKKAVYDLTAYAPADDEQIQTILKDNGLDSVKGDGYAQWDWDADKGSAAFVYVAQTEGLADFSMSFDLGGLKLDEIAKAQEKGEANPVASFGVFKDFSVKLKDEKALDVIFAISALQMGGSGEDLRQSAPALIRLSGAQAAMMNPRVMEYVNALADFVAKGGSLEITAHPAKPVPFADIEATGNAAPQTLPDVLNLEVVHKE